MAGWADIDALSDLILPMMRQVRDRSDYIVRPAADDAARAVLAAGYISPARHDADIAAAQDMFSAGPDGAHRQYVEDNEADWLSDEQQTEVYKAIIRTVSRSQGRAISGPTIYEVFGAIFEDLAARHDADIAEAKAAAWDEGYEAFAAQFTQPLDEAGQRPKATNPYRALTTGGEGLCAKSASGGKCTMPANHSGPCGQVALR